MTANVGDWNGMVTKGVKFVIAKALETGDGKGYHPSGYPLGTDPAWGWHKKQMLRVGGDIQKGAYCWLQNDGDEDTQADTFLGLLNASHDPTGWICALDVEGDDNFGLPNPGYPSVRRFAREFWRQAPGQPLLLYTRRTYWDNVSPDGDAKALGMTLWTAAYVNNLVDGSTLGGIAIADFDANAGKISFRYTAKTPYSGNYAGFNGAQASTIIQWGPLRMPGIGGADGNAFNGTVAQLRALSQPAEPVHKVTWNVPEIAASASVFPITQFGPTAGTPVIWSLPIISAKTVVQDMQMGSHIAPGRAVVTSEAPSAIVTGGL